MRKLVVLGFATVFMVAAIGAWAAATSREQGTASVASTAPIDPLALMQAAPSNLPHQQYDAI